MEFTSVTGIRGFTFFVRSKCTLMSAIWALALFLMHKIVAKTNTKSKPYLRL